MESDTWSRSRIPGAGPGGQDVYRITQLASDLVAFGGDFSYGWGAGDLLALQPNGQSRFYRLRWKFTSETDFNGRRQTGGAPGNVHRNKLIIVGDGSSVPHSRVIAGLAGTPVEGGSPSWNLNIGKDGGDDQFTSAEFTALGTWQDIQIEVHYSSAPDATDGYYRVWIDSGSYNQPTLTSGNIVVNRPDSNALSFGYIHNGIAEGSQYAFEHCEFPVALSFDAAWDR